MHLTYARCVAFSMLVSTLASTSTQADKAFAGKVKYIIHTKIGRGPNPMPESDSLVCWRQGSVRWAYGCQGALLEAAGVGSHMSRYLDLPAPLRPPVRHHTSLIFVLVRASLRTCCLTTVPSQVNLATGMPK